MRILFTIALFHLICLNSAFGQELQIKVNLESAENKEVYLAHYYISNIYIDDTIQLDATGLGILKRDTLLPRVCIKSI